MLAPTAPPPDTDYEQLAAEWTLEDVEVDAGRALRALNRTNQKRHETLEDLEAKQAVVTANTALIKQLDQAIERGDTIVDQKRARIEGLKKEIKLYEDEYTNTHRLLKFETASAQRMPKWWFLVMVLHMVLSFYAYSKMSWIFWITNLFLFLSHWRRLYIKTNGVPGLLSLIILPASLFWT